jgi:hypothetical protein
VAKEVNILLDALKKLSIKLPTEAIDFSDDSLSASYPYGYWGEDLYYSSDYLSSGTTYTYTPTFSYVYLKPGDPGYSTGSYATSVEDTKMDGIVIEEAWSDKQLRLEGARASTKITPIGTVPLVVNGGVAIPIARKIFAPAVEESLELLSGFKNGDLAELIGTSVRYADILKPKLINALSRMLDVSAHEIAPGIYRNGNDLLASCVICRYHVPKKKSKFRIAMEKLPVSGMTIMPVNEATKISRQTKVMEFKKFIATGEAAKKITLGNLLTRNERLPVVVLYELSNHITKGLINDIQKDGWSEKEALLISKYGKMFDGAYVIFLYDDHPELLGPIDKDFDYSKIIDHVMSEGALTKKLIDRRYNYGIRLLRKFIDEVGPVHFVSFTATKKIGIANIRDIIAIQQETGSQFTMWFADSYRGATSYAKKLYGETYGNNLTWSSGSGRQPISYMLSTVAPDGHNTVAYLLPPDEYVVGYISKSMRADVVAMKTGCKFLYVQDIEAGPEHKRLACGSSKMYDQVNCVGILTDSAPAGYGIYRLIEDDNALIKQGTYVIGLKKSQEELLAQV